MKKFIYFVRELLLERNDGYTNELIHEAHDIDVYCAIQPIFLFT